MKNKSISANISKEDIGGEPYYYMKNGFSPLQAFQKGLLSEEEYIGFLKGNIIKYVVRCDKKEDVEEDIDKAIDYLKYLKNEFIIYKED